MNASGTRPTVAAVLVAAGESRRMGAPNKLTLPVAGEPMLRRSARQLLGAKLSEVIVVLGHEADWARQTLADLPLRIVDNTEYQRGQIGSVNRGLAALSGQPDAMLIALADMPLLTSTDIDFLIDSYFARRTHPILVPFCHGQRGNPVIIDFDLRDEILAGGMDLGCRRFMDRRPELVQQLETGCDHYIRDIDTPADYAALQSPA